MCIVSQLIRQNEEARLKLVFEVFTSLSAETKEANPRKLHQKDIFSVPSNDRLTLEIQTAKD